MFIKWLLLSTLQALIASPSTVKYRFILTVVVIIQKVNNIYNNDACDIHEFIQISIYKHRPVKNVYKKMFLTKNE